MSLEIRPRDIALARSCQFHDPDLDCYADPERMVAHCLGIVRGMGIKIVEKPDRSSLRMSKFNTTFYRQLRVRSGFFELPPAGQAYRLAHEVVHARQWRGYGRGRYALGYLRARYRWAVEVQCYRESVRAMTILGFPSDNVVSYARERWESLQDAYYLGRIRTDDLRRVTTDLLLEMTT